ncbi:MAG: SpoVR family protein [Deltaproteobacteria bacterium]|nr:SpoVR family protein [Deltaproteobacteria bacterium]
MPKRLTPRLTELQVEIEGYARDYGLEPFSQIFEVVTYEEMNMVAAYGGFPKRYPHWRFGMEYERLSKSYAYGLSKIYELVINNDPCYAYLLDTNSDVDSKTVMAHVYGHNDFFKNNFSFAHTNRKMLDAMGNHSTRVRRLIDKHGIEAVETFIDRCYSLENLIDPHSPFIRRVAAESDETEASPRDPIHKLKVEREYMSGYINPEAFIAEQRERAKVEREQARRFPPEPRRDVLHFLLAHAPLEPWELDLLEIIREEAYYFAPQGQTKILNEGWATYWHSKIMTQRAVRDDEIIDYANAHAGVLATSGRQLNPYKLGLELLRDIEHRWDTGRFGKEFDECRDMAERRNWNRQLGLGREKLFEVRKHYNDVTFIDAFLTPEFCIDQKLFTFEWKEKGDRWEIVTRAFREVKQKLLGMLTNFGQPIIEVLDGNHENRGELLLVHRHEGVDLKQDHAHDTLENLAALWRRPVHLHTLVDEKGMLLSFDGREHAEKALEF